MIDRLVVVDYQEGAGGEFFASFLSAHWGHEISENPQDRPNYLQKWLNSNSLHLLDWDKNFDQHFENWADLVQQSGCSGIAAPYHLYKYPRHLESIKKQCPGARFVRINAQEHLASIQKDFDRKVSDRPLTDFKELGFLIKYWPNEKKLEVIDKFKNKKLFYKDLFQSNNNLKFLPSNDIEIQYQDWFIPADNISSTYQSLCNNLKIEYNSKLLDKLIQRNNKNYQSLQESLNKS